MAKTAWTNSNAGRRFYSCDRCRFFRWLDGPLCERAQLIIPGLLRRIKYLEGQQLQACSDELEGLSLGLKVIEEKNGSSKLPLALLILTWIGILLYWICREEGVEEI